MSRHTCCRPEAGRPRTTPCWRTETSVPSCDGSRRRTLPRRTTSVSTSRDGVGPAPGGGSGDDRADLSAAEHDPGVADRRRTPVTRRTRPAAPAPPAVDGVAAHGSREPHACRAVRALDRLRLGPSPTAAVLRADPLRPGPDLPRRVLPRGPAGRSAAGRDGRYGAGRVPGRAAAGVLSPRRPGGLVHADLRADALVRPGASRRAQGHHRLGSRDRGDTQPAAEPVHLTEGWSQPRAAGRRA